MTKKKSFLTLLLVFCLIVPAMLILPACGKVETTITAERYANAMEFKNDQGEYYDNIDILLERVDGENRTKTFQVKATKKAAYAYSTASDTKNLETIWTNENGKGVIYTKETAESKWVRTEQEEEFKDFISIIAGYGIFSSVANYKDSLPFDTKLEYNEEDQMYNGSYAQTSTTTVDVALKFENGKLVKVDYQTTNSSTGNVSAVTTRTITYGKASISIPKVETTK